MITYLKYTQKKQLNDIKILLILYHLSKQFSIKVFLYLIKQPICNLAKCKMKFKDNW